MTRGRFWIFSVPTRWFSLAISCMRTLTTCHRMICWRSCARAVSLTRFSKKEYQWMSNHNSMRLLANIPQSADRLSIGPQIMQRSLSDMVALSALPSLWRGLAPAKISESLAEVLYNQFHADIVYV